MKPSLHCAAFVAAALLLSNAPAQAVIINPGDTQVPLPGTTSALEPQLAGLVLVDEIIPFAFFDAASGGTISGQVQQRVVRSFADGTIDFYWRVFNSADSSGAVGAFRVGEFDAPEYNVNWRIDGLGDRGPDTATRFAAPSDNFVNFNFFLASPVTGLLPGEESFFFFFDTSAFAFSKTALFDLAADDGISTSFEAYEPAAVPEPATLGLLGLGIIGLARARKRSRHAR